MPRRPASAVPDQQYFSESIESAFTLVKAGLGYTLYPDIPQAREPGLCYVPVTDLPALPFGVYYRYDNDHPVLKKFLGLCAAAPIGLGRPPHANTYLRFF